MWLTRSQAALAAVLIGDLNGLRNCRTLYRLKDTACIDACPVDCIHPKRDEPNFAEHNMIYIDPVECIDCGACVPVCPVSAIFALDDLPEKWSRFAQKNAEYFGR